MTQVVPVDDPDDARLADYRALNDAGLRRRIEAPDGRGLGHGAFVAEGTTVIRRLLRSRHPVRSLLLTPDRLAVLRQDLDAVAAPVYVAPRSVLAAVAGFDLHRGAVAVAERLAPQSADEVVAAGPTLAVLEGLNDHENLGAIWRSAAALGVAGVLLDPTCADPLYRRCVRVSMGEVLFLPWARVRPWPTGLADLASAGVRLVALTPAGDQSLDDLEVGPGERVGLLLGAEGPGLSPGALAAAAARVRIPLATGVDSLNVGHAAAIAFHHVARSRRLSPAVRASSSRPAPGSAAVAGARQTTSAPAAP